ncbi:MAG: 30S ribosomal protein S4e [Candidatus Aenigmatarchaeota archaeon]|nr:MAG: 30S ribosomal protein S4e [Candidatus Aenigmarchaeota archaeon]
MVRVKRISAPATFPVPRKTGGRFAPTPSAGPHSKSECAPLLTVIRDALKLASTAKEARAAIVLGKVTVNGAVRKDYRFPVGIFDVVGVAGEHYRALPTASGLAFMKTPKKDAELKLYRVENKTVVRGGRVQMNLSDGTNILADAGAYATGDTLALKPDLKVAAHVKRAKGAVCVLIRGRNIGKLAVIESVNLVRGTGENTANLRLGDSVIQVPVNTIFVVGDKEPIIKME